MWRAHPRPNLPQLNTGHVPLFRGSRWPGSGALRAFSVAAAVRHFTRHARCSNQLPPRSSLRGAAPEWVGPTVLPATFHNLVTIDAIDAIRLARAINNGSVIGGSHGPSSRRRPHERLRLGVRPLLPGHRAHRSTLPRAGHVRLRVSSRALDQPRDRRERSPSALRRDRKRARYARREAFAHL